MGSRKRVFVLLVALCGAQPAVAEDPAIARFSVDGAEGKGVVFFMETRDAKGTAAIGTAHSIKLEKLVRARRVDFELGKDKRLAGSSFGLLAPPGRPFNDPGGSFAEDFLVFSLGGAPEGVRALAPAPAPPESGDRVEFLGIPRGRPTDQQSIFGRVTAVSPGRIEVELDVPYDLRGWGGAPMLNRNRQALGILQANVPRGDTSRVLASHIAPVAAALAQPLQGGAGKEFAAFTQEVATRAREAAAAAQATGADADQRKASIPTLIQQERTGDTRIQLDVEFPADGALVSDSICGSFIAGRALAIQGELKRFDVALVIDTSRSTADASGADINGNGNVGRPRLGRLGSMFGGGSTDPGDSILAAEIEAARQLLRGLDPRSTRVGVIGFAGEPPGASDGFFTRGPPPPAVTHQPLTTDYERVERALDKMLDRSPSGATHMAAGVDQATIELLGLQGALSEPDSASQKIVFFFTDGSPTLPYGPGFEGDNVRAVLRAASRASRGGIRIHSFAIGPDALDGPIATVEMASRTDGYFTPVRHPGDLVDVIEQVNFANLDEIRVQSVTTGDTAHPFRATADGSWGGFIKMVPGDNEIEIFARADDGTEITRTLAVTFEPEAPSAQIPRTLVVTRNRLLEDCLRETKQLRVEAEEKHSEEVRKSLMVEIEKERVKARERAEEQRKRLDLEVEAP